MLFIGLARFWAVVLITVPPGRDIEANLKRCSVKVLLCGCRAPMGTLGRNGKLGTM